MPQSEGRSHIDTFRFWKDQYSQLLLKYHELEQENAFLKIKNLVQKDASSKRDETNQNIREEAVNCKSEQARDCAGLCKIYQGVGFDSFLWRDTVVPQLSVESGVSKLKAHSKYPSHFYDPY
jgi:hypothetical protein